MKKKSRGLVALSLVMAVSVGLTACSSSKDVPTKNDSAKTTPDGQVKKVK